MKSITTKYLLYSLLIIIIIAGICLDKASCTSAGHDPNPTLSGHIDSLDYVILPPDIPSQIKSYEGFTLSFNKDNHTPNYVVWELLAHETEGETKRSNRFWNDPNITGCADYSDYTHSGYDRGHICPAADQKWSAKAMNHSFTMANITPQKNALNAGAWQTLESKEREWARRDSALIIISGPIYNVSDQEKIGKTGVRVPSRFFKILFAPYLQRPRAIGFIYPNMSSPGNIAHYCVSVREIEQQTGMDFFSTLNDELEEEIETKFSFHDWIQ